MIVWSVGWSGFCVATRSGFSWAGWHFGGRAGEWALVWSEDETSVGRLRWQGAFPKSVASAWTVWSGNAESGDLAYRVSS